MQFLTQHNIRNVVAITGDLHAFQCGIVRDQIGYDPRQPQAAINPPAGQLEVRFHKVKPLQQGQAPASPLLHTTRITLPAGSTFPVVH